MIARTKIFAVVGAGVLVAGGIVVATKGGDAPSLLAGTLRVEPASVHFGAADGTRSVRLINRGTNAATFTVTTGAAWLAADPAEGIVPEGGSSTVTLGVDARGLAAGTVTTMLHVLTPAGSADVGVSFDAPAGVAAAGPAHLEVTPSVDLGERALAADVRIVNTGAARLTWSARGRDPWLRLEPTSGALAAGASMVARAVADRAPLDQGAHDGVIVLESNGGAGTVAVHLQVGSTPLLVIPNAVLAFGIARGGTTILPFALRNSGHAALHFSASVDKAYVTLPHGGTGTIEPGTTAMVDVEYNFDEGYDGGQRRVPIVVASDGGSGTVTVTATTDSVGPYSENEEMKTVHRHCDARGCKTFRHAHGNMFDAASGIKRVNVAFQICTGAGAQPACSAFRQVPMRHLRGTLWEGDVGPFPACQTGLRTFANWRIVAEDTLGNQAANPGTATYFTQTQCDIT